MIARRALTATILILISVGLLAAPRRDDEERQPSATILCYHIVEAPAAPRMHIDRGTFRQHLRYLEMTGYNVIPLRHLYEFVSGKRKSLPKNAIVLTFDDGWRSTYTEAFPELQKRNFPFTVFVYPKIIGQTANALTWKQVREMADAGVDIQSHSLSHGYLTRRNHRSMSEARYAEWLQAELLESKRILEKHTGRDVDYLAYPYGDYDDALAASAKEAGYEAGLTCDFGAVRRGSNPLKMRRVVIDDQMDFAAFRKYLGAKPLQLAEMTPKPGKPVDESTTIISAKIPSFESLDPKSVGMALLSLGSAVPYSYDARNGEIRLTVRDGVKALAAKYHRAIVWGIDRKSGKRMEATWVFRRPLPPPLPPEAPATEAIAASMVSGAPQAGGTPRR